MTNWRMIASRARNYAKKIEEPSYSSKKVDIMDINASEALTQAYNYCGSEASVHTYNGGRQIIDTFHADGAQNHFDSEGENTPGDNDMDRDVFDYMSNLNESNNNNIMRNKIRINEATFKRIIAESVKGVLNEISPELMGAAAMTAAHRAQNTDDPYYRTKYDRQANAFAHNAMNSYEKENPSMKNVYFEPYTRQMGASFKRNSNGSTLRYDGEELNGYPHLYSETPIGDITMYHNQYYDMDDERLTDDSPERGFVNDPKLSNNDLRRYGRFKNKFNDTWNQMKNYQPKD